MTDTSTRMTGTSIAIAADDTYLPGLLACLHSVVEHATGMEVVVIDCGLSHYSRRAARETVADKCRLSFQDSHSDACLLGSTKYPAAMYARLFLGRHDFANRRVLYLDADSIVMGSLSELFHMPMSESSVAAVRDYHTPAVSSPDGLPDWRELGLDADCSFFNSGVMLVDLLRWKREDLEKQVLAHARRYQAVSCNDQHALNAALAGQWHELPPVWNATRFWFRAERRINAFTNILDQARIIHFIGPHKPWQPTPDIPPTQLEWFFRALEGTALSGWRPDRRHDNIWLPFRSDQPNEHLPRAE
jgi:lipopolysaccharide biosynthesis glycosyltransferase